MDEIGVRHDPSVASTLPPGQGLPVLAITAQSYAFLWREWRLLLLPLAVLCGMSVGLGQPLDLHGIRLYTIPMVAVGAALLMAGFEVGLYRVILGGERPTGLALLRTSRGLRAYALASLALLACLAGLLLILALPAWLVLLVLAGTDLDARTISAGVTGGTVGLAILVLVRLAMILPGRVIGETISLRQSWQATRGHWLALLALFGLTMAPFFALSAWFPEGAAVLLMLSIPVRTVALSLSYRRLTAPAA